jgi:hypothetical protein
MHTSENAKNSLESDRTSPYAQRQQHNRRKSIDLLGGIGDAFERSLTIHGTTSEVD